MLELDDSQFKSRQYKQMGNANKKANAETHVRNTRNNQEDKREDTQVGTTEDRHEQINNKTILKYF